MVLKKESPDGVLLTFGGQSALNCGIKCEHMGIFEKYNVKVLGTPIKTLELSEDRDLFAKALNGNCNFLNDRNKYSCSDIHCRLYSG
jgi:carbamoyl-phosphate synthase large subunit